MPPKSWVKLAKMLEVLFEGEGWISRNLIYLEQVSKELFCALTQILL